MTKVRELDLTPTGRYADGSPIYAFHTSFPSRGLRAMDETFATQDEAHAAGVAFVASYERTHWPGGMGECLGVVARPGGRWAPVVNTYYSNT